MTHKNKIIYSGLIFGLILSFISCISPITPHLNKTDSKGLLVVEGQITDQPGPFIVKLTSTDPVGIVYTPNPILNADVLIIDNQGNSFRLYGDSSGSYKTADTTLRGVAGNTYTLKITTADSTEYFSSPVLMQSVPDIDNVYFQAVTQTRFSQGQTYVDNWLNILLDSHDSNGITKYWRYDFEETWEVNMISDQVTVHHSPIHPENVDKQFIVQIDNKKICWITKPSAAILIASTAKNPVDEIKGLVIESLGPGEDRLHIRYSILVKQYAISAELYNYLQELNDVNANLGGIYSKIPSPVYGNITCSDNNIKALGYFAASSVKEKRLFINRSQVQVSTVGINNGCYYFDYNVASSQPDVLFGPDILTGKNVYTTNTDCSDCTVYGTNVKPSFW